MCCSDGYRDDLSRPPTVKMDDIKSMEVGEEEEGGWAGHHEEVDYSKEVVFSDSSDEEGSPKKSRASKGKPARPATSQEHQGLEGKETDTRSFPHVQDRGKEPSSGMQAWSSDKSHGPVEKGPNDGRDWRRKQKEHSDRRSDGDVGGEMSGRHGVPYHPYSQPQRPGPVPYPHHSQYPPNYNRGGPYGGYPPAPLQQYGPGPTGGHHYPQSQMGGGGRYQGGSGGGHRTNLKKNYGERDEYHGWAYDKDPRGPKRRWEEETEPSRPAVLTKEQGERSSQKQGMASTDKSAEAVTEAPPILSEALPIQRVSSLSSDNQEGGPKGHVTFADSVEEVEGDGGLQPQPTRRGSQPKLMLRKLGDKETDATGDGKHDGKDRPRDGKGNRPSDLQGLDFDDASGADSSKAKMRAWSMKERGPIISPKTLYEPEGKKSADKFKKYQAHTQEPGRVGGADLQKHHSNNPEVGRGVSAGESQGTPEEATEKVKSPIEKKEKKDKEKHMELKKKQQQGQVQSEGDRRSEQGKRGGEEEKQQHGEGKRQVERKKSVESEKEVSSHDHHVVPERTGTSADSNRHSSSRDKPHHRKEDSRRPRGGGGGSEKRSEVPARMMDNRQTDTTVRRGKEGGRKEPVDYNKTGAGQQHQHQQDRRYSGDQKGREERGRKREPLRSKEGDGGQSDRRPPRRDDGRSTAEHLNRGGDRMSGKRRSEHEDIENISEGRSEHRRHERGKGQAGGRGTWSSKGAANRQEDTRRHEHFVRDKHQHKEEFPKVSTQDKKLDIQETSKEGGKGENTHPGLGYTELEDLSSSDNEASRTGKQTNMGLAQDRGGRATRGRGGQPGPKGQHRTEEKGRQRGGDGRVGRGGAERRPRGDPARDQQQQSGSANRRTGRQKEERRRGGERKGAEDREFSHGGRGDKVHHSGGRERREQEKIGSHPHSTRPSEAKSQAAAASVVSKPSAVEGEVDSSPSEASSNRISMYDLNSYKVAIVDEIGTRGGATDEWAFSTETDEFVEVTSKKTLKEKMRKEKEEQRKEEEKRLEEQKKRKKKRPAVGSGQVGSVERQTSSANKPHSAWSTLDGRSDAESWNAAPGSQLKSIQQQQQQQPPQGSWVTPTLPVSGFSITSGSGRSGSVASGATGDIGEVSSVDSGLAGAGGGDTKPAVPHTAELVSSSPAGSDVNPIYNLFNSMTPMPVLYSHFSPSVTSAASSMLDAAVESTIGTVTSPRTVTSHVPLLGEGAPALPLDGILSDISSISSSLAPQGTPAGQRVSEGLLLPLHGTTASKTLPPRMKPVGRGRGAGLKVGAGGERRDRKRGRFDREQGGRPERTLSHSKVSKMLPFLILEHCVKYLHKHFCGSQFGDLVQLILLCLA